jgi:hypothetical protein
LEIIPVEIESVNRSAAICRIGRLLRRYAPANTASTAWRYGPKHPIGTPAGNVPQVVARQAEQVRRWSRYSSTIGSILGNSAT